MYHTLRDGQMRFCSAAVSSLKRFARGCSFAYATLEEVKRRAWARSASSESFKLLALLCVGASAVLALIAL